MKTLLAFLTAALVLAAPAQAQPQPRVYSQAELDTLLAPVALHPDGLLSQILIAATYPEDVAAAASWSRANPHLRGDDAVRAVQYEPWDPAVKALVAFPDLLARMDESPQWLRELGDAFLTQQPQVMETVQGLRRRAQAAGHLTDADHSVYQADGAIVVQPRAQVIYVRYYDPYVVYGPWWWGPYYQPVFWRPWVARPVYFTHGFFYCAPDWRHHHVRVVHRPVHVPHQHAAHVVPGKWNHLARLTTVQPHARVPEARRLAPVHSRPSLPERIQTPQPRVRVPEANRQPIAQQRQPIFQQHMPAAHGFSNNRPQQAVREPRSEPRREQRVEVRPQQRVEARPQQRMEPRREQHKQYKEHKEPNHGRGHRG